MEKIRLYQNRGMFPTLQEYLLSCCRRHTNNQYCLYDNNGVVSFHTYGELWTSMMSAGTFLSGQKLRRRHVALLGETSFEWNAAYLGCLIYGIVVIPLDRTLPKEKILSQFLFAEGDALVFDPGYKDVADYIASEATEIRCYALRPGTDGQETDLLPLCLEEVDAPKPQAKEGMAEIVFTSGTMGREKAVMLSYDNLLSTVMFCIRVIDPPSDGLLLSFLPNHHTYEQTVNILTPLYFGTSIGINDSTVHFMRNMRLFHPTHVLFVPSILNSIRKEAVSRICKLEVKDPSEFLQDSSSRKMLMDWANDTLGGRLTTVICGGACLQLELAAFFEQMGIRVIQGYGMTECSPLVSCNSQMDTWKLGRVSPYCEVSIRNGEICVRGRNVMMGYYRDPELTEKVLVDGWFHTGDAGKVDEYNCLSFEGRMDRMLVLSNGENVNPEELEEALKAKNEIEDCMVFSDHGLLTVDVVPEETLRKMENREMVRAKVHCVIWEANQELPYHKRIKRIYIRRTPFEKTSTYKTVKGRNGQYGEEDE